MKSCEFHFFIASDDVKVVHRSVQTKRRMSSWQPIVYRRVGTIAAATRYARSACGGIRLPLGAKSTAGNKSIGNDKNGRKMSTTKAAI